MLKIYGRANSVNVQKALWAADECGLVYERTDVGGAFGGNDQPWYRAMNPNGIVPTIDDNGYTLWESNAIVRYFAASHAAGTLWPLEPRARGEADRWMDWQPTVVAPGMTTLFWGLVRTPADKRDNEAIEKARVATAALWQRLDGHLAHRPFVAGATFTMGDIPAGAMVYRWLNLPFKRDDLPDMPHLKAWYDRLTERPAYRQHIVVPMT